ncbi:MAG: FAD-dependent oxidoreductase [Candidatus Azambacteria bacterium]|nr:FAD-dependent oxidoreductase [Candidatus Azambacteria bacterium]
MHDLIIIGGGPAGVAAGVYAARKKLKSLMITDSFGGQSLVSDSIENWIGIKKMTGLEFAKMLENHIRAQEDIEIKTSEKVVGIKEIAGGLEVETEKGNIYQAKTIIVASGGRRRRLGILGEDKFEGKGVSYCSTCDAPIFKDKSVAVIGGGNAGLEAVIDLVSYAGKVYLINNKEAPVGDPSTQEEVLKSDKTTIINNADAQEIIGDKFVSGLKYLDKSDNQVKELKIEGIFVEIGSIPNSEFIKHLVKTNQKGEIIVNHKTGATSHSNIFAAGDVTDEIYKQNNISAGDAIAATLSVYNYLLNIKKI